MKFKVGDEVEWCGIKGKVVKDHKFKHPEAASLEVEFEAIVQIFTHGSLRRQTQTFLYDGRLHPWHREPSLKPKL